MDKATIEIVTKNVPGDIKEAVRKSSVFDYAIYLGKWLFFEAYLCMTYEDVIVGRPHIILRKNGKHIYIRGGLMGSYLFNKLS